MFYILFFGFNFPFSILPDAKLQDSTSSPTNAFLLFPNSQLFAVIVIVRTKGVNLKNVQWLVFDIREELERFRTAGSEFLKQLTAIQGFAPLKDIWDKRRESGIDDLMHKAPVIVATYSQKDTMGAETNTLIALAYFDIVASTMGLGCCRNSFFTAAANNFPPIKEVIALREGHVIHKSLEVGYPKYKRYRIPHRNPAQITWR